MTNPSTEPSSIAERRLHSASWLFAVTTRARGLLLPGLALLVTARFTNVDILLLPAAIVVVVNALVQQLSLRYVLGPHEIVVRRNFVVHRSERHIPYTRIHNLKTSESPIHRWLHVVEVGIETAGGGEPEATLRVLSREALAELRSRVSGESTAGASAGADAAEQGGASPARAEVVLALSFRELVLYGLLNNRGFVIAGALAGLAWEVTSALHGGEPWDPRAWMAPWRAVRARLGDLVDVWSTGSAVWLLAWLAAALLVLKVLSVVWSLVSLHGFRVERSPESLVVRHGLFPRRSTVIPFARIQRVVVREKPMHRLTGHLEVQLDTVGRTGAEDSTGPVWLAPLTTPAALPHLLALIELPLSVDALPWQALHPRAARRMRTQMIGLMLVAGSALWPILGIWSLGALAAATPMALFAATRQARHFAYVASPYVAVRSGWLWRTMHLTWIDRVHTVAVTASPFDRRHEMASLLVDIAAGRALEIPFLAESTARDAQRRLARDVAAREFSW